MAQLMSIKKNVDVQPGAGVPAIFHCSQGDKGTRIILGLLNNNDSYTIPEGTTAIIRGSRADGTLFTEITADIDTTTEIKFNLTEDMTSVAGPVECEAVLASGSANIIGTANFIIDVEKSPASIGSVFPGTDAAETWLIDKLTNLGLPFSDVNAESAMIDTTKIYRYDGALWFYDGTEWAKVGTGSGAGSTVVVTEAADMTDNSLIYLYEGTETGYTAGHFYYYNGTAWVDGGLYYVGRDGTNGTNGQDGFSPVATVETTLTGARISITDKNGTTSATVQNGTATDAQVAAWLDDHPEATTTVEDGAITVAKLSDDVLNMIEDGDGDEELTAPYYYPSYTSGTLNTDGTVNTDGTGNVTNYLPVKAGETLTLSSNLVIKIGYYTDAKIFIPSLVSVTTGMNDYVVPATAAYARLQCGYQRSAVPLSIRKKTEPKNRNLFDLIFSPIKSRPSINIAGDSNTYGYGLSDRTTEAWSYLFANELANITNVTFSPESQWVEALGMLKYSVSFNAMTYAQMSIWTDATSVTLGYANTYSGKWTWYIDDVQSGDAGTTATTLTLDGNHHKVTVRVTGGQVVTPYFVIPKAITVVNTATSGVGPANFQWQAGHDWLLVMIGTNGRSVARGELSTNLYEYRGKGTFIIPFPNHKTDSSYTYSELYTYANLKRCFEDIGFETLDLSAIAGNLFYDNSAYQSDLIHFNAVGHRYIANAISGALGMPLYLKTLS